MVIAKNNFSTNILYKTVEITKTTVDETTPSQTDKMRPIDRVNSVVLETNAFLYEPTQCAFMTVEEKISEDITISRVHRLRKYYNLQREKYRGTATWYLRNDVDGLFTHKDNPQIEFIIQNRTVDIDPEKKTPDQLVIGTKDIYPTSLVPYVSMVAIAKRKNESMTESWAQLESERHNIKVWDQSDYVAGTTLTNSNHRYDASQIEYVKIRTGVIPDGCGLDDTYPTLAEDGQIEVEYKIKVPNAYENSELMSTYYGAGEDYPYVDYFWPMRKIEDMYWTRSWPNGFVSGSPIDTRYRSFPDQRNTPEYNSLQSSRNAIRQIRQFDPPFAQLIPLPAYLYDDGFSDTRNSLVSRRDFVWQGWPMYFQVIKYQIGSHAYGKVNDYMFFNDAFYGDYPTGLTYQPEEYWIIKNPLLFQHQAYSPLFTDPEHVYLEAVGMTHSGVGVKKLPFDISVQEDISPMFDNFPPMPETQPTGNTIPPGYTELEWNYLKGVVIQYTFEPSGPGTFGFQMSSEHVWNCYTPLQIQKHYIMISKINENIYDTAIWSGSYDYFKRNKINECLVANMNYFSSNRYKGPFLKMTEEYNVLDKREGLKNGEFYLHSKSIDTIMGYYTIDRNGRETEVCRFHNNPFSAYGHSENKQLEVVHGMMKCSPVPINGRWLTNEHLSTDPYGGTIIQYDLFTGSVSIKFKFNKRFSSTLNSVDSFFVRVQKDWATNDNVVDLYKAATCDIRLVANIHQDASGSPGALLFSSKKNISMGNIQGWSWFNAFYFDDNCYLNGANEYWLVIESIGTPISGNHLYIELIDKIMVKHSGNTTGIVGASIPVVWDIQEIIGINAGCWFAHGSGMSNKKTINGKECIGIVMATDTPKTSYSLGLLDQSVNPGSSTVVDFASESVEIISRDTVIIWTPSPVDESLFDQYPHKMIPYCRGEEQQREDRRIHYSINNVDPRKYIQYPCMTYDLYSQNTDNVFWEGVPGFWPEIPIVSDEERNASRVIFTPKKKNGRIAKIPSTSPLFIAYGYVDGSGYDPINLPLDFVPSISCSTKTLGNNEDLSRFSFNLGSDGTEYCNCYCLCTYTDYPDGGGISMSIVPSDWKIYVEDSYHCTKTYYIGPGTGPCGVYDTISEPCYEINSLPLPDGWMNLETVSYGCDNLGDPCEWEHHEADYCGGGCVCCDTEDSDLDWKFRRNRSPYFIVKHLYAFFNWYPNVHNSYDPGAVKEWIAMDLLSENLYYAIE